MTTLFIIGYILLMIGTYYYTRWLMIKCYGREVWDWLSIFIFGIASITTIFSVIITTFFYFMLRKESISLKPPKWL